MLQQILLFKLFKAHLKFKVPHYFFDFFFLLFTLVLLSFITQFFHLHATMQDHSQLVKASWEVTGSWIHAIIEGGSGAPILQKAFIGPGILGQF